MNYKTKNALAELSDEIKHNAYKKCLEVRAIIDKYTNEHGGKPSAVMVDEDTLAGLLIHATDMLDILGINPPIICQVFVNESYKGRPVPLVSIESVFNSIKEN